MLILKRNCGQSVTCILPGEEEIVISVSESSRGAVSVAIEAPRDISILRSELVTEPSCSDTELLQLLADTQNEILAHPY